MCLGFRAVYLGLGVSVWGYGVAGVSLAFGCVCRGFSSLCSHCCAAFSLAFANPSRGGLVDVRLQLFCQAGGVICDQRVSIGGVCGRGF